MGTEHPALIGDAAASEQVTVDRLAGSWWICQSHEGQRYTTDDVLLAWTALRAWRLRTAALPPGPVPPWETEVDPGSRPLVRVLDLGAGVGSVGLLVLLGLGRVGRLVSVEIQARSASLLRQTATLNRVQAHIDVRQGDLRDQAVLTGELPFDIVVSNPPYLPVGTAGASPWSGRAAARLEMNGTVAQFCQAAAEHLSPTGVFVLCHAASDPRPETSIVGAGLRVLEHRDVVFREGDPPRIALFTSERAPGTTEPAGSAEPGRPTVAEPLCVRDRDGRFTPGWRAVRREMWIES
jgi:tRNA1(Val) A37 N6-methylase TrmN6